MPRLTALAVLLLTGTATAATTTTPPPVIAAAAAAPARADDAKDDARRHGPEIAAFAGVKPGDTVVDLVPGGGYWTRLFAAIVGPRGHVYGVTPREMAVHHQQGADAYAAMAGKGAYANVSSIVEPAGAFSIPTKADVVFTAQNYHDYPDPFMGPTDPAALDRQIFTALKPGGVFVVIDHAAEAGSGMRDTNTLHRIDPAVVKAQATAAGFRFAGSSRVLANPADDHRLKVFDPAIRGHTDQFAYKFVKPR